MYETSTSDVSVGRLPWGQDLVDAIRETAGSGPALGLIRHSERDPVLEFARADEANLTAAGEAAAYAFGCCLPPDRRLVLGHSPVRRCQATAERVAEGFASVGGQVTMLGEHPDVGPTYVVNPTELGILADGMGRHFVRAWFDGRLPQSVVRPREAVAREHLQTAASLVPDDPQTLTLLVTHDWNIMAVKETFLGVRHEESGWADFLDGPLITPAGPEWEISWREHRRRVPLAGARHRRLQCE